MLLSNSSHEFDVDGMLTAMEIELRDLLQARHNSLASVVTDIWDHTKVTPRRH
jgi:hypothetical protein